MAGCSEFMSACWGIVSTASANQNANQSRGYSQTADRLGLAFDRTADGIEPVVMDVLDWPREFLAGRFDRKRFLSDHSDAPMRNAPRFQHRDNVLRVLRATGNHDPRLRFVEEGYRWRAGNLSQLNL